MLLTVLLCSMSKMPQKCNAILLYLHFDENETAAFVVIQSHGILGHMVKCFYVIGSIRYWTYYMMSRIHTMRTFKV